VAEDRGNAPPAPEGLGLDRPGAAGPNFLKNTGNARGAERPLSFKKSSSCRIGVNSGAG
jgi:hypothetical protein